MRLLGSYPFFHSYCGDQDVGHLVCLLGVPSLSFDFLGIMKLLLTVKLFFFLYRGMKPSLWGNSGLLFSC